MQLQGETIKMVEERPDGLLLITTEHFRLVAQLELIPEIEGQLSLW